MHIQEALSYVAQLITYLPVCLFGLFIFSSSSLSDCSDTLKKKVTNDSLMATDKPKIQGYLEREVHEQLSAWKEAHGIQNDSKALNEVLADYFKVNHSFSKRVSAPAVDEALVVHLIQGGILPLKLELGETREQLAEVIQQLQNKVIHLGIEVEAQKSAIEVLQCELAKALSRLDDPSSLGPMERVEVPTAKFYWPCPSTSDSPASVEASSVIEFELVEDSIDAPLTLVVEGATTEVLVEAPTAVEETVTRQQLMEKLSASERSIYRWRESGELAKRGWEAVPGTAFYRRIEVPHHTGEAQ